MALTPEEVARGRSLLSAALPRAATPEKPAQPTAAYRFADYIKKVVDAAPPLTPEQRDRIAVLLRPRGAA